MYVVLCYDIGVKRVSKVMKISKKYLQAVQRSVFEGYLTEAQLRRLQTELRQCIDIERDSVIFYLSDPFTSIRKCSIGVAGNTSQGIL